VNVKQITVYFYKCILRNYFFRNVTESQGISETVRLRAFILSTNNLRNAGLAFPFVARLLYDQGNGLIVLSFDQIAIKRANSEFSGTVFLYSVSVLFFFFVQSCCQLEKSYRASTNLTLV
jgi:hypothetical protein